MKRYKSLFISILLSTIIVLSMGCANESGGGGGGLGISIRKYNLDSKAQTVSVTVVSNLDVTLAIPANAPWITYPTVTRESSPGTTIFTLSIVANLFASRNSTITFTGTKDDVVETNTITITQAEPTITLGTSGQLEQELTALHPESGHVTTITNLTVIGEPLNAIDFTFLKTVTSLVILDIVETRTTIIPAKQFETNTTITQVLLPDSLTTISADAFKGSGVTSVRIPASVTTWGALAFANSANLTEVTLEEGLKSMGAGTFMTSGITSVTIPASIESWGWAEGLTFLGSRNLTEVIFAEGLRTIGKKVFEDSGVTSVTLPESLLSLDTEVFLGCALTTVTSKNPTPPEIESNTFPSSITNIYVPSASVNAYKTATNWSTLANKISAIQ